MPQHAEDSAEVIPHFEIGPVHSVEDVMAFDRKVCEAGCKRFMRDVRGDTLMADQPFRMANGRMAYHIADALTEAHQSLHKGNGHTCDLVAPVEALTGHGRWFCVACLYEHAWRDGYVRGVRDGQEYKHGQDLLYLRGEFSQLT
jgi:hypothetical protein